MKTIGHVLQAAYVTAGFLFPDGPYNRGQRRLDSDSDLPGWLATYVRVSFAFWGILIACLIYRRHFRPGRDGDRTSKQQEIESKLEKEIAGISSSNAIAQPPGSWRLATRSPNNLARVCFWYARSNGILNSQLQPTKGSTFFLCFSVSVLLLGIYLVLFAIADDSAFLLSPFILLFVIFPSFGIYSITHINWQNSDSSATARALSKILDGRIKSIVSSDLLRGLEPAPGEREDDPGYSTMISQLQRSGYASRQSWALYSSAVGNIFQRYNDEESGQNDFRKVHDAWFTSILPKATSVFARFTDALDDTRERGRRMAARKAMTLGMDAIGDLVNAGNDIKDMKEAAKEMKKIVKDIKETRHIINNASSVTAGDTPLVEHSAFHPIPRKAFLIGSMSISGMLGLFVIYCFVVPHENGKPIAYGLLAFIVFLNLFMYFLTRKNSANHNTVEDMIDIEIRSRKTMEGLIASGLETGRGEEERELVLATNDLRQTLMDNFYAALAIHATAECMTYRGLYDNNSMLFPREEAKPSTAPATTALDLSPGDPGSDPASPIATGAIVSTSKTIHPNGKITVTKIIEDPTQNSQTEQMWTFDSEEAVIKAGFGYL